MKRFIFSVIAASLVLAGLGGNVYAKDNFTITNFDAEYTLGRDAEKRSTLDVTWRITANFPPNQNHGLAPIFVKDYDGHKTSFKLQSVKDETGRDLQYSWNGDELRIGDKDIYVEGQKTYIIKYSQRDVTRYYADTDKDEFYWDVIGDQWRVPISSANIKLKLSDEITSGRQTAANCYQGRSGSNQRCVSVDNKNEVEFKPGSLGRLEGVTVALGFAPGTFMPYQKGLADILFEYWLAVQGFLTVLSAVLIAIITWRYYKSIGRTDELGTITPEYIPPKNISVLVSANILQRHDRLKGSAMVAQLLDLAVRHYIVIYESGRTAILKTPKYEIEIIKDLHNLLPEEREILSDMFSGALPKVGSKLKLDSLKNNRSYARRTMDDDKTIESLMNGRYGLRTIDIKHKTRFKKWSKLAFIFGILLLSPPILIVSVICLIMAKAKILTDKGLALRRYLAGLKMYIKVAESERIKLLQSPEGAAKVKVDANDEKQMIKLYERILPYAVLFGEEKSWSKQLGEYYEQAGAEPDWYGGQSAFNAAVFVASVNSLSSSVSSVSSYSSTSGGSAGSGYSGGGGGGGGGGGW